MMEREEFGQILGMRLALWDNAQELPVGAEEIWYDQLRNLDAAHVKAALMAYSRDGHAFPPVVGQLWRQAVDLADDTPEWGAAWKELRDHCGGGLGTPEMWSHEIVWEAARQITLSEIGNSIRGDTTFEAQCRGVYESIRERWRSGIRYEGIPGVNRAGRLQQGFESVGGLLEPKS
jgi:hypothetical protein